MFFHVYLRGNLKKTGDDVIRTVFKPEQQIEREVLKYLNCLLNDLLVNINKSDFLSQNLNVRRSQHLADWHRLPIGELLTKGSIILLSVTSVYGWITNHLLTAFRMRFILVVLSEASEGSFFKNCSRNPSLRTPICEEDYLLTKYLRQKLWHVLSFYLKNISSSSSKVGTGLSYNRFGEDSSSVVDVINTCSSTKRQSI